MTESGAAARVRQASVADVDVIVHQKRSMFADTLYESLGFKSTSEMRLDLR